ncbi:MAG: hypothetical protein ACYCSQ_06700 [bacterium]
MEKVFAYLDILGFGNHAYANINEAIELLNNYQLILNQKITDEKLNPIKSYGPDLQDLALQNSVNSFEYFLPFSDSLFIQSANPNVFVRQLSSFLLNCFLLTANSYSYPENPSEPIEVTIKNNSLENGKITTKEEQRNWHPLLFRGGISYGEGYVLPTNAIHDSKLTQIINIAGRTIVKAVKELEPLGKGPRLFCDIEFYNKLDKETKQYCKMIQDNKYFEILWPAFHFIKENDLQTESYKIIPDLIKPVTNLWKAYKDFPFGIHFKEFLKLTICASTKFFEIQGDKSKAEIQISNYMDSNDIDILSLIC